MKIQLTGVKEIDEVFRKMPDQLQDKVLQDAHGAALKTTITKARLLAPEGPTGNLVDSLGVIKDRRKGNRELGVVYGGPRRGRYKGHAGHLVEFGTGPRETKKGANRGIMPAKPFMEPAWYTTKDQVLGDISTQIGKKLYTFMKRTIKK